MSIKACRAIVGAFGAAAAMVVMASVALASHTNNANPWFCTATNCDYGDRVGKSTTQASANASYYSMLGGAPSAGDVMSANAAFTLRYVTGNHTSDLGCYNTTEGAQNFLKTNGQAASFTTGSTGSWDGEGPVSMPAAAGLYTICAKPNDFANGNAASNSYYPFYVV